MFVSAAKASYGLADDTSVIKIFRRRSTTPSADESVRCSSLRSDLGVFPDVNRGAFTLTASVPLLYSNAR